MPEVLLLCVHFDDAPDTTPTSRAVTLHHPSGRRFVVTELADTPPPPEDEGAESIW
ncbi:hypothetical protein [Actinokineospora sp. NPDC004072]